MPRRAKTDTVHLRVRVKRELQDRLAASAKRNRRSANLEIVDRLEETFRRENTKNLRTFADFLLNKLAKYEDPATFMSEFVNWLATEEKAAGREGW